MTDRPDFKAMRERCENATAGPWTFTRDDRMGCAYIIGFLTDGNGKAWTETRVVFGDCDTHDAQFIAHARTDLPACLARIAELESCLTEIMAIGFNGRGYDAIRAAAVKRRVENLLSKPTPQPGEKG